jgi:hypothetical protein
MDLVRYFNALSVWIQPGESCGIFFRLVFSLEGSMSLTSWTSTVRGMPPKVPHQQPWFRRASFIRFDNPTFPHSKIYAQLMQNSFLFHNFHKDWWLTFPWKGLVVGWPGDLRPEVHHTAGQTWCCQVLRNPEAPGDQHWMEKAVGLPYISWGTHVCMYACMYVMYVCMDGCMHACNVCMYACMHVCM